MWVLCAARGFSAVELVSIAASKMFALRGNSSGFQSNAEEGECSTDESEPVMVSSFVLPKLPEPFGKRSTVPRPDTDVAPTAMSASGTLRIHAGSTHPATRIGSRCFALPHRHWPTQSVS